MKIRIIKKLAKKYGFSLIGIGKVIFAIVDANGNMEYRGANEILNGLFIICVNHLKINAGKASVNYTDLEVSFEE